MNRMDSMDKDSIRQLLESVRDGDVSADSALERLRDLPFEAFSFAAVDHHRNLRCGFGEVIFCQQKTIEQVLVIFKSLADKGGNVLATRANPDVFEAIHADFPDAQYNQAARTITLRQVEPSGPSGRVAVVAAGTSDLPVAEEACVTAEIMDQQVTTHYDGGVAGLHRLLAHSDAIRQADAVVAVAGMEGALASVVGGLVDVPVIAVPTSIGYGASFGGLAALLAMLNSCASGVTVVNIDNGFGGGYEAAQIARQSTKAKQENKK